MSSLNVERIKAAIEHLKRPDVELGHGFYRTNGKACCAVGLMVEVTPTPLPAHMDTSRFFRQEYGLSLDEEEHLYDVNDHATDPQTRKAAVINYLESLITQAEGAAQVG